MHILRGDFGDFYNASFEMPTNISDCLNARLNAAFLATILTLKVSTTSPYLCVSLKIELVFFQANSCTPFIVQASDMAFCQVLFYGQKEL